jgi:hypothetical protein
MNLLKEKWLEHKFERLGQFLVNYVFGRHKDIFFQQDELTEEYLRNFNEKEV